MPTPAASHHAPTKGDARLRRAPRRLGASPGLSCIIESPGNGHGSWCFEGSHIVSSFAQLLGYGGVDGAIEHHNSRPAYLLKRAEQTLTGMYLERCRARELRLSLSQLFLLCAIESEPGSHQAAAARMAGMDTPT